MNEVDNLLKVRFSSLPLEDKIQIKTLGPHQPKDFTLSQSDGKKKRNFCSSWFTKKPWLTVSLEKCSLFCFYCLLFGGEGESVWSKTGYKDLKHLSEKIKKHEECAIHLSNACKFKMFGTVNIAAEIDAGVKISIQKHNEEVRKNRHVVDKVIDCLKFCGSHELALRGHDETESSTNRGNFLDLLSMVGSLDSILSDHLNNATVFKCTSRTIQNELLECMYNIYMEDLKNDVNNADFVSVQADETTDITCISQFVTVLRFVKDCKPVERFVCFSDVQNRTAEGLYETLKQTLEEFKVDNKLIAQAYDGANVMSGANKGVQTLMLGTFPHAKYVNCYAHQLNLVVKNACSKCSKSVRLFFANVSGFSTFFHSSPKRSDLLRSICDKSLPTSSQTRWNFHSRVVTSVRDLKDQLITCFEKISEEDGWDDLTTREACGFRKLLQDEEFVFFLNFFGDVLKHVEILYNTIQKQDSTSVLVDRAFKHFEAAISDIRQDTQKYLASPTLDHVPPKRRKQEECLSINAKEVCDVLVYQMKERFENSAIFHCFAVIDPKMFATYGETFPTMLVNTFANNYSNFLFKDKLKNELVVIYQNETFRSMPSVTELFRFFKEHDFQECFSETYKALQIALTTPVTTAESERCFSTLKRIKSYLRNTMGQERLNALAVCSIHRNVILDTHNFNNRVIDLFASKKDRRAHLLFK